MKILAIYDSDISYASRLMDYIMKSARTGFETMVFTRKDSLKEFLNDKYIEILLLGEGMEAEELPEKKVLHTFVLTELKIIKPTDKPHKIFKYQAAKEVLSDIMACYARLEDHTGGGRNEDLKIISVFAPLPGPPEAAYSWFLAACLAEKGKALYLPFELLPVPAAPAPAGEDQAQSEFAYYLKEKTSDLITILKRLLKYSGKLPYLSGLAHGLDLLSLNKGDAARLIDELKKKTDYDKVILYLGMYTEFTMELMNLSDRVDILCREAPYSAKVNQEWERQMRLLGTDTGQNRFRRISLPDSAAADHTDGVGIQFYDQELWKTALAQADML